MRKRVIPILLFVCITAFSLIGSSAIAAPDYLTYEEFISFLEQGKIRSVEFRGSSAINGVYLNGTREEEFSAYSKTGSANDPLLTALLKEKGVSISIKDDMTLMRTFPMMIASILMFILPIVILIFILRMNAKLNRLIKKETQPH